jgi:hypothetical protein
VRRVAVFIAIAAGVVLIAMPAAYSMFGRTADAERILDRFTFLTLDQNPQRYLDEAVVAREGSSELVEEAIPELAARAGVAESELEARSPALVAAQQTVPEAREFSVRYSEQLEAVKGKFRSVYDIPVPWLPLTAVPLLFSIAGLAAVALGLMALRLALPGPLVALTALGALLVLGPVALGGISKSSDAEDVKDFAQRGLTEPAASAAQEGSAALDDLATETEQTTLPFLAEVEGVRVGRLRQELAAGYPDAAEFLDGWDVLGPRLGRLANAVSASVAEFDEAERLPIALPVWVLLAAGLLVAGSAGYALIREGGGERSRSPSSA